MREAEVGEMEPEADLIVKLPTILGPRVSENNKLQTHYVRTHVSAHTHRTTADVSSPALHPPHPHG